MGEHKHHESLEARAAAVRESRAAKNDLLKKSKLERDLQEEIELDHFLDTHRKLKIDTAPEFPGCVIYRLPSPGEASRFRQIMWKESKERGVVEAKAKAGGELARACVVYPSREKYEELVATYTTLPDAVAKAIMQASDAEAEEEGKG